MKQTKPQKWLMKSEPSTFSIDDLKKEKESFWDGVRNYQARNFMMKDMEVGQEVLFYHSNAKTIGITGLAVISKKAQPDLTALNKKSEYFDPKATPENPRWYAVSLKFKKKFQHIVTLEQMRKERPLKNMLLLKKGQRLSIQPVTEKEFQHIINLTHKKRD